MLRFTDRAGRLNLSGPRSLSALILAAGVCAPAWAAPANATPAKTWTIDSLSAELTRENALQTRERLDLLLTNSANLDEASELTTRLQRLISGLTSDELAIQRAEIALGELNLISARRHLTSVIARDGDADLVERAQALLARVSNEADLARPGIAGSIESAEQAIARGDLTAARVVLSRVDRLGLDLGLTLGDRLALAKDRILEAELQRGTTGGVVSASLVAQPAEDDQPEEATPEDIVDQAQRAAAQSKLAEAQQAWDAGRRRSAGALYRELLDVYGEYLTQAQRDIASQRLQQVGSVLATDTQPLESAVVDRDIQRQVARREFESYMADARRDLDSGATEEARVGASQARLTLNRARIVLSESEYQERLALVDALLGDIVATEESLRQQRTAELNRNIARETAAQEGERREDRARRVNEALERARLLQAELKYEEAIEVVDQALFLDPTNPAALLIKEVLSDIVIYDTYADIQDRKRRRLANMSIENLEASIPPDSIINYPTDWPTISFRRSELAELALSSEDKRVYATLDRERIPVRFDENSLEQAVEFVREVAGVNVDVNWRSLEEIGINKQTPVSLRLTNVPVKVVLDRILDKTSDPVTPAGWAVRDGVVTIASQSLLDRDVETLVYDVRDLLIEVPDYEELPEFDLSKILRTASGEDASLSVSPFGAEGQGEVAQQTPEQPRIDQIMDIIRQNVGFDSWQANGGSIGSIQELGGNLIVTNTPDNHRQVSGLLSRLREFRAMQINVEARFLTISQDFFEQLGFDVDVVFNPLNNQVRAAQAASPSISANNFFDLGGASNADQAINGQVIGSEPGAVAQGVIQPDNGFSPVPTQQNSLGLTESLLGGLSGGGFTSDVLSSAPALGVAGRFLDDIQVDFLVKATQADQRSSQLTAPRITFTNGQTANIRFTTQTAFVSNLTPVVAPSSVGFTPQIGVASEGVSLGVEGTISADRRYVTLSIDTSTNSIDGFAQQPVTAIAGGEAVSSADVASFVQLPTQTITRVQTTVTVPDQGTVLLGGQKIVNEFEVETGVPVLSKIPFINRFFTNRIDASEESTLLILVKPTILIQNEEEEKNFPGLLDSLRTNFGG